MIKNLDVVALGGNAILPSTTPGTIGDQVSITLSAMEQVVTILERERQVLITHGNGPIVGNIVIRNEAASETIPPMPLDVCGADSQGGIGYMVQQVLHNVVASRGLERDIVSVITQVVVDNADPAFQNPVKPIGPFYTKREAGLLQKSRRWQLAEDSRGGYRRVVASPAPLEIVELDVIRQLVAQGTVVIAAGGGGIPVIRSGSRLEGCEAVIDKDLTSALLANELSAERLIILTDIDAVYQGFGTANARPIQRATVSDLSGLIAEGEFPKGSMGAKIDAVLAFLSRGGRSAIICRPIDITDALDGHAGTTISS